MPWCSECGAEYREGFLKCAKCGAALVSEPTALPKHDWREYIPSIFIRFFRRITSPISHAITAFWLIKRHPSLLLLPLLLAFYSEVALRQAASFGYQHITDDYQTTEVPIRLPVRPSVWARERQIFGAIINDFTHPIPTLSLVLKVQTSLINRHITETDNLTPSFMRLLSFIALLVGFFEVILSALIWAGYYGLLGFTTQYNAHSQNSFAANVKLYWFSFFKVGIILWILLVLMPSVKFLWSQSDSLKIDNYAWFKWTIIWLEWLISLILSFFFALPLYVLVIEGGSTLFAIKRSIITVATHLPEMLTLLVGFVIARGLLLWPLMLILNNLEKNGLLSEVLSSGASIKLWALSLGSGLVIYAWTTIIGVWICLTIFFWYRDVQSDQNLNEKNHALLPKLQI